MTKRLSIVSITGKFLVGSDRLTIHFDIVLVAQPSSTSSTVIIRHKVVTKRQSFENIEKWVESNEKA
jgi:hypothetical protein